MAEREPNGTEDGGAQTEEKSPQTERGLQRTTEEQRYRSVIIKRTDEAQRHPDDTLQLAIESGKEQLERGAISLFLSAVAAGFILGFTAMAVALAHQLTADADSVMLTRFVAALVYPLGFVICVMSATELYTEHTATAVYPVLDRRASFARLMRLWGLVIAGNLAGAFAIAGLLTLAEDTVTARDGYIALGAHLVGFDTATLFVSAVLAGALMALGAWLIYALSNSLSQMLSIYIVTFLIGLGGLHHSIAGSVEMFTAMLASDRFALGEVAGFIGVSIAGNAVGGTLFVAVLNYGHIRESQTLPD